ncbi:MAG: hypothetical protein EBW07_08790, partial [Rhodobacteraceae bacterium]|nr:hypothetical protein [Paracoccaceae bacterium]
MSHRFKHQLVFRSKIVINTCVRFRECLNKCFESLIENVKDFKKYQDVIVVIGGCERMEEPKLIPIRNITDLNSDLEVVVIKTPVNN